MTTYTTSHADYAVLNTDSILAGSDDSLLFIGCSSDGVTATGTDQTIGLINDSWIVITPDSASPLTVLLAGDNSNITINDMGREALRFTLMSQGSYTLSNNTTGPIGGAFLTTAHISVFIMGATAASLAADITRVG